MTVDPRRRPAPVAARFVADPGGPFVVVGPRAARWILDALAVRLRNLDARGLDAEVFEALVALRRVASCRSSDRPAPNDGPSADAEARSLVYDTAEAAQVLGVEPRAVRRAARERRLLGELTPSGWRFAAEALEQYRPRGRTA